MASDASDSAFYAIFSFTGNVRIGALTQGIIKQSARLWANGTYAGLLITSSASSSGNVFSDFPYGGSGRGSSSQPSFVRQSGYFLISVDLTKGSVNWLMPIIGMTSSQPGYYDQQQQTSGKFSVSASRFDGSAYLLGSVSGCSNLVFGSPLGLAPEMAGLGPANVSIPVAAGSSGGSTTLLVRIDRSGQIPGKDAILVIPPQAGSNTQPTISAVATDNASPAVYLSGSWGSLQQYYNQLPSTATTPTLVFLGGSTVLNPVIIGTASSGNPIYATQNSFIARCVLYTCMDNHESSIYTF